MATATRRPTPPASAPPRPPAKPRRTAPPPRGGPPPQARNARRHLFWPLMVGIPLLVMALAAAVLTLGGGKSTAPVAGPPLNRDTVLGRPDAPVEIEEWGDFQ